MKIKKMPKNKRTTYKLYDDNGKFVTEYKPGVDGVTEADILLLHKMDDCEVNANCKELKLDEWFQPFYDEWKKNYITRFEKEYGRKPFKNEIPGGHRVLESIDSTIDEDDDLCDKGNLQMAITEKEEEIPPEEERLAEIIAEMPETWRRIYDLVLLQGMTAREAGKILGVSASYVSRIKIRIIKTISEDERLKEILH